MIDSLTINFVDSGIHDLIYSTKYSVAHQKQAWLACDLLNQEAALEYSKANGCFVR